MASIDPDPAFRRPWRRRVCGAGPGCGRVALVAVLLLAVVPVVPAAERFEVRVVAETDTASHAALLAAMRRAVGDEHGERIGLQVQTAAEYARAAAGPGPAPKLVVTVGVSAGEVVLQTRPPGPVLCAFLPRAAYDTLRERQPVREMPARTTALYVDQPPVRQLQLLRLALPQARQVGVVLGADSQRDEPLLRDAAAAVGVGLEVERIGAEHELVEAVRRVLGRADALLAVPDRLVFNRHTAQNVLLSAWRRGKPVMGYSHAYVDAGALLAVFSTPEQIGRQLGETLAALAASPRLLPAPQYPRYYSVSVNARVARSLGLRLPPAEWLAQRLTEAEDSGP